MRSIPHVIPLLQDAQRLRVIHSQRRKKKYNINMEEENGHVEKNDLFDCCALICRCNQPMFSYCLASICRVQTSTGCEIS